MQFKDFTDLIIKNIKNYLPDEFADAEVSLTQVNKNNGITLDGLIIKLPDEHIIPTIYPIDFFSDSMTKEDINKALEEIAALRIRTTAEKNNIYNDIFDFEKIKDNIVLKLISYEKNKALLENVPFRQYNDLAAVYELNINDFPDATATTIINNELMKTYKTSEKELHSLALINSPIIRPYKFLSMNEIFSNLLDEEIPFYDDNFMYVLNTEGTHGAAAILYPGVLDKIANHLKSNFLILPSSIDEVIIIPDDEQIDVNYLLSMVREVNKDIDKNMILSDSVYKYDALSHELINVIDNSFVFEYTVNTNMGEIPINDYRDILVSMYGFDSINDLHNKGLSLGEYDYNILEKNANNFIEPQSDLDHEF